MATKGKDEVRFRLATECPEIDVTDTTEPLGETRDEARIGVTAGSRYNGRCQWEAPIKASFILRFPFT